MLAVTVDGLQWVHVIFREWVNCALPRRRRYIGRKMRGRGGAALAVARERSIPHSRKNLINSRGHAVWQPAPSLAHCAGHNGRAGARVGETGDPREDSLTNGIVRLDLRDPVSMLTSHQDEPDSIPGRVSGLSHVGIVPDDTVGRRVFSGIPRFPRYIIPAPLHAHLNHPHRFPRPRCREPHNSLLSLTWKIKHFISNVLYFVAVSHLSRAPAIRKPVPYSAVPRDLRGLVDAAVDVVSYLGACAPSDSLSLSPLM
ncbi:hypothetical protein PR048_008526 [Dryococelus australis]|uniref:Uncharacterized protein n=1 Tax=Dryococelus australis TaxID=614101 RepID=A0ABQ9HXC2_9NEOP|nr:hypothetical protein PR048_008526 [Dryococelus australis]